MKKHFWLLISAGLPVVVAFLALSFNTITKHFVDLPKYDFLYALMPKYDQPIRYYLLNGDLRLVVEKNFDLKKLDENVFPKLYIFHVKNRKSEEIPFDVEPLIHKIRSVKQFEQKISLDQKDKKYQFYGGRQAKDGYRIITFDNAYMVGSQAIIFNLTKSGYILKVPYPDGKVDFGHRASFIGWAED